MAARRQRSGTFTPYAMSPPTSTNSRNPYMAGSRFFAASSAILSRLGDSFSITDGEWVNDHDKCLRAPRDYRCEDALKLIRIAYCLRLELNPQFFGCASEDSHIVRGHRIYGIPKNCHA